MVLCSGESDFDSNGVGYYISLSITSYSIGSNTTFSGSNGSI